MSTRRLSGCGSGTEYLAVTPWGDFYPCHQFVGQEEFLMGNVDDRTYRDWIFVMNSSAATCMPRKNAGTALQDFTAAEAVQQIHTISMEVSMMPMISDVSSSRSEWNAPS